MDNQHRKITGYRELTETEIALLNEIKALGLIADNIVKTIEDHILKQHQNTKTLDAGEATPERLRLLESAPLLWKDAGRHDLQTGLMKLCRAVAQPTHF
jgi:hypothetical protein